MYSIKSVFDDINFTIQAPSKNLYILPTKESKNGWTNRDPKLGKKWNNGNLPLGSSSKKKKMKVWNLSKGGGGGVKPQIQTFLVFILEELKSKSGDHIGRMIPIFGSNL
jgi:hypothetical protein